MLLARHILGLYLLIINALYINLKTHFRYNKNIQLRILRMNQIKEVEQN